VSINTQSLAYAQCQDKEDVIAPYRDRFYIPKINDKEAIYLCGNSLGLQAKSTASYLQKELGQWAKLGVEGHFKGENPWLYYHKQFSPPLANLLGTLTEEVVCMNALTVNLHLLFASFYQPKDKRNKILIEADCFPSDRYAVDSQIAWHGLEPAEELVALESENHELTTERIIDQINSLDDSLALVWLGGVNYFSGQVLDMQKITKAAHEVGAIVGFDLAHAIGNVALNLHEWDVDFATWCSYKYLNSSAGGVSGIYVHQRHAQEPTTLRLAGWWGTKEQARFEMKKSFEPIPTAESWQLSNAPVLAMAAHKASLDIFEEVGFKQLLDKSKKLTSYLAMLLEELVTENKIDIITPKDRGCQLSLRVYGKEQGFIEELREQGVILDWRKPKDSKESYGVMRVAPVPLYNSFTDVWQFVSILKKLLE